MTDNGYVFNWKWYAYEKTKRLSNGQRVRMQFQCYEYKKYDLYYTELIVASKRKTIEEFDNGKICNSPQETIETGKCGLEALLWAKNELINFEPFFEHDKPAYLCVEWADNQRKRVYEYGLRKCGFKMMFLGNENVLAKLIMQNADVDT